MHKITLAMPSEQQHPAAGTICRRMRLFVCVPCLWYKSCSLAAGVWPGAISKEDESSKMAVGAVTVRFFCPNENMQLFNQTALWAGNVLAGISHYINANSIEIFEENGKLAKKLNKNAGFLSLSKSDGKSFDPTMRPEWMQSPMPQVLAPSKGPRFFRRVLIYPAEGLLSICMIIIWLTNVKQELVKVSHLQKVTEDEQRLIQSNYSSTSPTNE